MRVKCNPNENCSSCGGCGEIEICKLCNEVVDNCSCEQEPPSISVVMCQDCIDEDQEDEDIEDEDLCYSDNIDDD